MTMPIDIKNLSHGLSTLLLGELPSGTYAALKTVLNKARFGSLLYSQRKE